MLLLQGDQTFSSLLESGLNRRGGSGKLADDPVLFSDQSNFYFPASPRGK